jgi:hypothetical protein
MKKLFLFLSFIVTVVNANAATRTSVAAGAALNPFVWDCNCIPLPGDDVVINHAITLNTDFGYSSGSITVNASGSLTGDVANRIIAVGGGFFVNHGTVNVGYIYHSAGTFTNHGTMTAPNAFGTDASANTVNHGTLTIPDSLYINTNATLTNNGTLTVNIVAMAGNLTNTGNFNGTGIWTTGTIQHNSGSFVCDDIYNGGTVNTGAPMHITNDFWNTENVDINHDLVIDHSFYNGDTTGGGATFNNDGIVSVGADWSNSKTVSGSGRFCISGISSNSGSITGTLDICDQSGGGGIDLNSGTIAGTVTTCAINCNVDVAEEESSNAITVYPNPFNEMIEIRAEKVLNYDLVVVNAIGQTVVSMQYQASTIRLDGSKLPSGMYFYKLSSGNKLVSSGRMVKR